MGDKHRQPDPPASAEAMFGASRPAFRRARRGLEPTEVGAYLDMVESERSDLGAALLLTQARVRELSARLERFEAMEEELTRLVQHAREASDVAVREAQARAAAVVADAEATAARTLAAGRAVLAEEEEGLSALHMAIAAEAATLASLEDASDISRAAAALVEIVDGPGGLGPFSQAASTLIEFAQLLQRTARNGGPPPHPTVDAGPPRGPGEVIDLRSAEARSGAEGGADGAPVPNGQASPEPAAVS